MRVNPRNRVAVILLYLVALFALVITASPYVYMLAQSLAPWDEVQVLFFPTSLTLRSYRWLWTGGEFGIPRPWMRSLLNSLAVTAADTISRVVLGAIVGYALSVLAFRGQRAVSSFILFHMFYPAIILLVPTFLIIQNLGFFNTYMGMILPWVVSVWAVFMYSNLFGTIPRELVEAARLDGAGELTIIARVMVPMASSITTVIFLFLFMERWVELLWDLIIVSDPNRRTLNVLLATMFGPYGSFPGPLYAASVLLTFPILFLFIAFSRSFVSGVEFVIK
jgi:multiple sugar transport system permease protein